MNRGCRRGPGALALLGLALVLGPGATRAQPFEFQKQEGVAAPVWSQSVQAGLSMSGGNAPSSGVSAEASVSRTSRLIRLQLGGSLAVARARVAAATDSNAVSGIGKGHLRQQTQTTRQAWNLRSRYNLFATAHSSAYASLIGAGDRPAGKQLVASGQLGYGLDAVHTPHHLLRLEAGYDLSREQPVIGRILQIHSARFFLGYRGSIDQRLDLSVETEVLTNLNAEWPGGPRVGPLHDTRALVNLGLTHRLNGALSVCLRLGAAYDSSPPLRPPPPGTSFEPGHAPQAARLDRTADLSLRTRF